MVVGRIGTTQVSNTSHSQSRIYWKISYEQLLAQHLCSITSKYGRDTSNQTPLQNKIFRKYYHCDLPDQANSIISQGVLNLACLVWLDTMRRCHLLIARFGSGNLAGNAVRSVKRKDCRIFDYFLLLGKLLKKACYGTTTKNQRCQHEPVYCKEKFGKCYTSCE